MKVLALDWAIAALAIAQVLLAFVGMTIPIAPGIESRLPPTWAHLLQMAAFSATAAYLSLAGRRDRRAVRLALLFVIVAASFTGRPLRRFAYVDGLSFVAGLWHAPAAAFLPYAAWRFFAEFPRAGLMMSVQRGAAVGVRMSAITGAILFVASVGSDLTGRARFVRWFDHASPESVFWPVVLALTVAAVAFGIVRARRAPAEERRRVEVLTLGIVLGGLPIATLATIIALWPAGRAVLLRPQVFAILEVAAYGGLLAIPTTTAYAVHVRQALDVRIIVRTAVQYALARYTLLAAAALPFAGMALLLYQQRQRTIVELARGGPGVALLAIAAVALTAMRARTRLMAAIDRRFFREQYDARRILGNLVHECRDAANLLDLERLVTTETDRALHLERVCFLSLEPSMDAFVARTNTVRPLYRRSKVVGILQQRDAPFDVVPDRLAAGHPNLPGDEREWLAEGGFRLLVCLTDASREVIGILALGEKRSGLPFTQGDRRLLVALAETTAVTLQRRLVGAAVGERYSPVSMAGECTRCGRLFPIHEDACPGCGGDLVVANVPTLLSGKFRLDARIGIGGMGVVYRAADVSLGREVAIKTLPRMGTLLAWRLRREARAMAAVSHPNLAAIYGLEAWSGVPMLVVEYLAGGTLASRLKRERLSVRETLELGISLADALATLHRAGILHRDIKPSNIGFTHEGVPKLLDFGLSRFVEAPDTGAVSVGTKREASTWPGAEVTSSSQFRTTDGVLVGTAEYLSPEAVGGASPAPSFDLWSLALVLYETISGTNPFSAPDLNATLFRICQHTVPSLRDAIPDCPDGVAVFFEAALSLEKRRRPASARVLGAQLRNLRASLTEGD